MQRRLGENAGLLAEVARLEEQNNQLQGFNLDGMTASDLSRLIRTLTQAVERVRITVQLRRLSSPASSHSPAAPTRQPPGSVLFCGEGTVAGGVPPHPGQCHGTGGGRAPATCTTEVVGDASVQRPAGGRQ